VPAAPILCRDDSGSADAKNSTRFREEVIYIADMLNDLVRVDDIETSITERKPAGQVGNRDVHAT
jgi:hypothetical protein